MTSVVVAGALASKVGSGGEAWVRLSYALGLRRLGCDVRLVEEAPGTVQAVTVQHGPGPAYDDAVALRGWLEGTYPDLDVVLVGPVEGGPPWRIGVD